MSSWTTTRWWAAQWTGTTPSIWWCAKPSTWTETKPSQKLSSSDRCSREFFTREKGFLVGQRQQAQRTGVNVHCRLLLPMFSVSMELLVCSIGAEYTSNAMTFLLSTQDVTLSLWFLFLRRPRVFYSKEDKMTFNCFANARRRLGLPPRTFQVTASRR